MLGAIGDQWAIEQTSSVSFLQPPAFFRNQINLHLFPPSSNPLLSPCIRQMHGWVNFSTLSKHFLFPNLWDWSQKRNGNESLPVMYTNLLITQSLSITSRTPLGVFFISLWSYMKARGYLIHVDSCRFLPWFGSLAAMRSKSEKMLCWAGMCKNPKVAL